ncbi:hypothetical protein KGM_200437 [Danaus plexippus plexippus]|uniref:Uncharacterized protein n=1 Tax=Danaus plexippus plexippus TaxID=278856 RepID=A0A212EV32_DANPL|nr:hypothetical protein KGM_200437 [Danaus plexippus plexippus]
MASRLSLRQILTGQVAWGKWTESAHAHRYNRSFVPSCFRRVAQNTCYQTVIQTDRKKQEGRLGIRREFLSRPVCYSLRRERIGRSTRKTLRILESLCAIYIPELFVIAYLIVRRDARKRPLEQVAGAPGDRPRQSFSQCARSLAASGSVVVRGGTRSYCDHVPMFVWWSVILVLQTTDDMSCERRTKAARFLDLR